VTFDDLRVPVAELGGGYGGYPVYYEPFVYIYYSGAFHLYSYRYNKYNGTSQVISSGASEYAELPMTASVPRGYYYRVYVYVDPTQPGYSPHYDPATVDSGNGTGGSVCSAWPCSRARPGTGFCSRGRSHFACPTTLVADRVSDQKQNTDDPVEGTDRDDLHPCYTIRITGIMPPHFTRWIEAEGRGVHYRKRAPACMENSALLAPLFIIPDIGRATGPESLGSASCNFAPGDQVVK
jgi:hypothetical protein